MSKFKPGEWVISESWVNPVPRQILKVELASSEDEEDFVLFKGNCCVELKYIQKWSPKPSDWCWNSIFGLVRVICETKTKGHFICWNPWKKVEQTLNIEEPFIGELPSNLKDL